MTTFRYKLFEAVARLSGSRKIIAKASQGKGGRDAPPTRNTSARFKPSDFQGRRIWTIHPKSGPSERIYVHYHGGAFVLGLNPLHYATIAKLCDLSGVSICLPDYPYAPQHQARETIRWAGEHLDGLIQEHGAQNVVLGGDSAGANLAVVTTMQRRDAGQAQPRHLLLMSPWVDLEMAAAHNHGPTQDVFLVTEDLQAAAKLYAGELDVRDPRISPIFGDLSNLAPMSIFTGEIDRLHPDIMDFATKVKAQGTLSKLAVYGEFGHIWMFYPTPDRDSTLIEMAAVLRS